MLFTSLAVQAYLVPRGAVQPASRSWHPHRHVAVQMAGWDYAKQFAQQQEAQRVARLRRLEAEADAEEAKENAAKAKAKGGFQGGIKEVDTTIKQLNFDERVTSTWESSEVPDFMPEEGSAEYNKFARLIEIPFAEGMRGSQHDGDDVAAREAQRSPEMAIDADPTLVYMPAGEDCDAECQLEAYGPRDFVVPEPKFNVKAMKETSFDGEFDMFVIGKDKKSMTIDVAPIAMAFEDFYCGFTADSHPAFRVTQNSFGKMERRNGAPTSVEVTVDPAGAKGQLVGHLCFILPEEKDFSTFYKITCDAK